MYLGHFTFKKSDILKSDRFLSCQTNKFSAKVAGLWRSLNCEFYPLEIRIIYTSIDLVEW